MKSIWTDTVKPIKHEVLQGDAKTDVLIIGGGLCGVLCAMFLKEAGVDYMLVEKDRIAMGITKNTTAKITAQHGLIYDKLVRDKGVGKAQMYLKANEWAIKEYRKRAERIDCDFENKRSGVYSRTDNDIIEKEIAALDKIGYSAEYTNKLNLPFDIKGAVLFEKQAQFNPLKFINAITENLNIKEHTFVNKVKDRTAYTDRGNIKADKIIIATHFPFINTRGSYFLKLYLHRSYVIALKGAPDVDGMFIDENDSGFSFRNYNDLLLVGGGGHRTGSSKGKLDKLKDFTHSAYGTAKEIYLFAAQDCMSLDKVAYIGNYSSHTPNWYVASGFNKWGMTSSMVAARLLCDMVCGKKNELSELYSPSRSILKTQLLINGAVSATNLLTPGTKRCPHMGCMLKWNKAEHTWDCPCHGSRFDEDGGLIDNPAKRDAAHVAKNM